MSHNLNLAPTASKALCLVAPVSLALLLVAPAWGQDTHDSRQGYVRSLEGDVTLVPADDQQPQAAQVNIPLVRGDRFELAEGARLELVLADRQKLHLGSAASIELVSLARSLDEEGRVTVVRLHHGSLHLQVPRDLTAAESPRVDTSQASLFLEPGGEYLVETGLDGRLSVVVRAGYCELVTADGSSLIRAGEGAEVAPGRSSRVQIASAPGLSELELWADALELEASNSELPWIEADLQYEAAPLAEHGDWVDTAEGAAWKPRVTTGWKPYWNGYWTYAPAGMTWVSNERWGWLPYHYGSWDHDLSFGWVWYPGVSYSPAHVYWYWGSSHVAWVPAGYYRRHYRRHYGTQLSFNYGVHGYSRAHWSSYNRWVFCPTSSLGLRHQYRFHADGRTASHQRLDGSLRGGIITTDTRGLSPDRWRRPGASQETLRNRAFPRNASTSSLPDVTSFVERRTQLSSQVQDRLLRPESASATEIRTHRGTPRTPQISSSTKASAMSELQGAGLRASSAKEPSSGRVSVKTRVGGGTTVATGDIPAVPSRFGSASPSNRRLSDRAAPAPATMDRGAGGRERTSPQLRPAGTAGTDVPTSRAPRTRSGEEQSPSPRVRPPVLRVIDSVRAKRPETRSTTGASSPALAPRAPLPSPRTTAPPSAGSSRTRATAPSRGSSSNRASAPSPTTQRSSPSPSTRSSSQSRQRATATQSRSRPTQSRSVAPPRARSGSSGTRSSTGSRTSSGSRPSSSARSSSGSRSSSSSSSRGAARSR